MAKGAALSTEVAQDCVHRIRAAMLITFNSIQNPKAAPQTAIQNFFLLLTPLVYLISLLARASTSGGIVRPICFAV